MSSASRSAAERLRVLVLGYLVRGPLGGMAWHHLQYVLGLARLGHDVYFVEDSGDVPWSCYDPARGVVDRDPTYGLAFASAAFDRLGLGGRWACYDAHRERWHGPGADRILDICATADLLLNVSCANPIRPWYERIQARILIDTDPVFTQVRNVTDPERRRLTLMHTGFYSFGENIGRGDCTAPHDGLAWRPTRQPIVLDAWPVEPGPVRGPFTTVMQWDSYPAQHRDGRRFGVKSESFEPFMDLPSRTNEVMELAVGGETAPRDRLARNGWKIRDPLSVARDPWLYQDYLRASKAEFTVAKQGYVITRSGWFSERSAAYLASGRPVVTQDTGFGAFLPVGVGLLPYSTLDEARERIEDVGVRYPVHCRAAREIAAEEFDSRKVLERLISEAMTTAAGVGRRDEVGRTLQPSSG